MDNIATIQTLVTQLILSIDRLRSKFRDSEPPQELRKLFMQVEGLADVITRNGISVDGLDTASELLLSFANSCSRLGDLANNIPGFDARDTSKALLVQSRALIDELRKVEIRKPFSDLEDIILHKVDVVKLRDQFTELEKHDDRLKRQLTENDYRIAELEARIKSLESEAKKMKWPK